MEFTSRQLRIATGVTVLGGLMVVAAFVDAVVPLPVVDSGYLTIGAAIGVVGALALIIGRPTHHQRLAAQREDDDGDR